MFTRFASVSFGACPALCFALALLLVGVYDVCAQARLGDASDAVRGEQIFHEAAQHFLTGDVNEARRSVEQGLATAPGHPKLLALRDVLDQPGPKPQPDSGRGGSSGTPQSNPDAPDGQRGAESSSNDESSGSPPPSEQTPPDASQSGGTPASPGASTPETDGQASAPRAADENAPNDDAHTDPGAPQSDAPSDAGRSGDATAEGDRSDDDAARDGGQRDGETRPSNRISRSQAERILRALEGQEKQLLREVQKRPARPQSVEKDW